jgi:hypothetical protein
LRRPLSSQFVWSGIDGLEVKIDDIQDAVVDAIILATDTLDGQIQDHEHRLTVLERQAA